MCGSGSSGGGNSTVTQVQQLPLFQQQDAQQNENIANTLASTPYPTYSGQTIAGFTDMQNQGLDMYNTAATAQNPYMQQASNDLSSVQQWNPQTAQQYMSPYTQAALQPQINALNTQQALNSNNINKQATMEGAFGDNQNQNAQALNNFYGNQSLAGIEATGMNTAYNSGQTALNNQNTANINAANVGGQLGTAAENQGISGANAVFNAGTQQQQLNQEQLTESYNNFMNQVNWPMQMNNLRISALANSPYQQMNYTSLAPQNATAQNLGALTSLTGAVSNLFGTGSNSNNGGIFGSTSASTATTAGSDRRLKRKIKKLGKFASGLPVYTYQYLWDDTTHIGVMADEVEGFYPEAVITMPNGFKAVDYSMVR